jgi:hypothetical protein
MGELEEGGVVGGRGGHGGRGAEATRDVTVAVARERYFGLGWAQPELGQGVERSRRGGMEGSGQLSCAVIDGLFVATVRVNGLETWPMVAYNGALDPQTFQNLQPKTLLQLQASAIETGGFLLPLKKTIEMANGRIFFR